MQQGLEGYRAWRKGDTEALGITVSAYNKRLIYYIFSMTGQSALSEDLAVDVFVRLMLKKPEFTCEEQLSSWLFKTARNVAIDARRRKDYAPLGIDGVEQTSADDGLLDDLLFDESKKQLHAALRTLSDDGRNVLTLLYFEEFSYKEIASILRKDEKQIKNIAYRSRLKLKEQLERMGFVYEN